MPQDLPLPSFEMRELVGPTDPALFDNPKGALVFPDIPFARQETVFDFGCGCGRIARQLIQQNPRPKRYVGIDIHKGMIAWCLNNLKPHAEGFEFLHHDVFNVGINPKGKTTSSPFPVEGKSFKLVVAWSVFTHLVEQQAIFYLKEVSRILDKDGIFLSTWFTFDKQEFPMMQTFQNALYINDLDPTNAVIFDRKWLQTTLTSVGLSIIKIAPPEIKGFQWIVQMMHAGCGEKEVDFPPDLAPIGIARPPVPQKDISQIGL